VGLPEAQGAVNRIVPVRDEPVLFCEKETVVVPPPNPLFPSVMESQLVPEVTEADQFMVPLPVFETEKVVVPEDESTFLLEGAMDKMAAPSWVMVMSFEVGEAHEAVTLIVPVREEAVVFWVLEMLMVPLLVPLLPEVMDSQSEPEITEADQVMVPLPVFETLKVVVPEHELKSLLEGVTDKIGLGPSRWKL
jgi:hypothetical protein